jgi:peptide/nickel transport system substrate-binding protein
MHTYIRELQEQYRQGKVSRREFMRFAALLGLSMGSITSFLASCAPAATPTAAPAPTKAPTLAPVAGATPVPTQAPVSKIKRGGELRVVGQVQRLQDPAKAAWFEFNIYRNVAEYLTVTNQDNVTEPWLLEKWQPSDDLKTWTLSLRKGIKFNHGPELKADDVVFNIQRWLDPKTESSISGLMGEYLSGNDVEKVDDYTVKLHLGKPQIGVPEHLFHYPAAILPKDWGGDWIKQPYGTGPFTLEEYIVEERALLKRREGYWRNGEDGQALPYLDSIRFVDLGSDPAPFIAALTAGEVDLTAVTAPLLDALAGFPDIRIATQVSSFTHVIRMRADHKPFDDARVRKAIKICQDREQIRKATMRDYGAIGQDFHVAPIHPEYCPMEPPARDIEMAKKLLADAGYPDGIEIKLATMNAEPIPTIAQLLKEQCAPAGINITLDVMPDSMYWEQWMDVDFGITSWTHRPLATMLLSLAYRTGVPWNESHWSNAEFDDLLTQAEGTLDLEERRKIMCQIQTIMKEEGPVLIPRWAAFLWGHNKKVQNYRGAPHDHIMLYDTWLDPEA